MKTNLTEFDQESNTRPTLLTVLCILTFIGSGWAIASSVYGYTKASQTAAIISRERIRVSNDSILLKDSVKRADRNQKRAFGINMMKSLSVIMKEDNIRKSAVGTILSALFTLSGALLMWWYKRLGFYFYITGVVIGIIVPFYLYGNNLLAVGISSISTFFGLVFIALYALNLKGMQ